MKKKTILIYGISSFLGSSLAEELKDKYRIIGTYYRTIVDIEGILTLRCDVNNKELVEKIAFIFKPDFTIYAIGLTDLDACQEFPKLADALNTAGVFNVSTASERYNSKFIYFSNSYIFSGENILLRENDTPAPSSIYGSNVASSEFYIQKSCLNYIIFRSSPIIGRTYNPNDLNWIEVLEKNLFLNKNIVCDSKVYTGFIDISTISNVLIQALEKNITNRLFQISSADIMTRYDFAKLFVEIYGGNQSLLSKGDWQFPRTENQLALQSLGDELFFKMDTFNIEEEFNVRMPYVEDVIKNYQNQRSCYLNNKTNSKSKSSGIKFI